MLHIWQPDQPQCAPTHIPGIRIIDINVEENISKILIKSFSFKKSGNLVIEGNSISQIQKNSPTKFCHWPDWKENFWNFDYCQIKYWPKKVSHKLLNLKIALLLFPQSTHETRAIKFCDRMLLHIATNSVIPGSHIRNLQNMPIWYYPTEIREVLSLHGFFLLKTRVFVGYSIYIFEIPIGLLIVLCKWYVDYKSSSCGTSRHSSQVVVGHLNLLWAVAAFLQH